MSGDDDTGEDLRHDAEILFTPEHLGDEKKVVDEDVKTLHSMGYSQELSRRMHAFSNFAVSFSIICILAGGITSFQSGFSALGGFGVAVGWIVGGVFALVVANSMAQIASAYPTAGGLYHWSSILGGRGLGWATAWINLLGLIFVIASVNVGVYTLFNQLILGNIFGIDTSKWPLWFFGLDTAVWGSWQQLVGVAVITLAGALFNHFGIRVTTKLIDFSGYLIFAVAIVLTITVLAGAKSFDFGRLVTIVNNTGDPGGGVWPHTDSLIMAFALGLLLPLYTITGFDGSAHTSEETVNARVSVPKGMINSVLWSLVFGFVMVCSFVLAMPDTSAAAKDGANVFFNLLANLSAPVALKNALYIAIVLSNFLCGLAALTSTSRMVFAFARDGGLPKPLRAVSHSYRSPVGGIWAAAILSVLVTIYSAAFSALAAGCAVFLYISYAMPIAAGLFTEGKKWTVFGPFRLGALSKPFAVITVVGTVILFVIGIQPPNDVLIQYSVGIVVLLAVLWLGFERRRFAGPPIGDEIKRRQAQLLAEEAAVGEAAQGLAAEAANAG